MIKLGEKNKFGPPTDGPIYEVRPALFVCDLCGFATNSSKRRWMHIYLEWAWWRPFDKRPYHVRNKCVRWLP